MSDSDSFIDEVSEELRRDQLFKTFRKYGWIAVAIVLVLVGGAAIREYRNAQSNSAAEALGDSVLNALREEELAERSKAFASIEADGDAAAVIAFLESALNVEGEDAQQAAASLETIAANGDLPIHYRHLASLKRVMVLADTLSAEERVLLLEPLTSPGAPYRVLAEEQIGLAEITAGNTDAALARFQALAQDSQASPALRRRATDVIVALGGTPTQSQ